MAAFTGRDEGEVPLHLREGSRVGRLTSRVPLSPSSFPLSMLKITGDERTKPCTPNLLPCKVHKDGPVDASPQHWAPEVGTGERSLLIASMLCHWSTINDT